MRLPCGIVCHIHRLCSGMRVEWPPGPHRGVPRQHVAYLATIMQPNRHRVFAHACTPRYERPLSFPATTGPMASHWHANGTPTASRQPTPQGRPRPAAPRPRPRTRAEEGGEGGDRGFVDMNAPMHSKFPKNPKSQEKPRISACSISPGLHSTYKGARRKQRKRRFASEWASV